jgi:mannose-6-phosphate isomerase-like protein (cupin superfamily)
VEWKALPNEMDERAPDGSEVRLLVGGTSGSMAHFRLGPGETSTAKQHASVEELWYVVGGHGEMCVGDDVIELDAGVALRIPPMTRFQFRCTGPVPLQIVAVTMPPWPGPEEARDAGPYWPAP